MQQVQGVRLAGVMTIWACRNKWGGYCREAFFDHCQLGETDAMVMLGHLRLREPDAGWVLVPIKGEAQEPVECDPLMDFEHIFGPYPKV